MKKLTLNEQLLSRLDRLPSKIGELNYVGLDLPTYEGLKLVAVVGTRKPTPYGIMMTEKLVGELVREGVVIVSGLALGVDGIAHNAAIKGGGRTIAVLPSGLNNVYPATNQNTARQIVSNDGTLISEYSADHMPRKVEFLERNRIIAALSAVVVIPEAAGNSGSLNTAMHAKKLGIPICAVPGNATSPMSTGTNYLIKNGAMLITEASDVLKLLGIDKNKKQLKLQLTGENEVETLILQKLSVGITDAEGLQAATELEISEFQTAITMLEVQGKIASDGSGKWRLT